MTDIVATLTLSDGTTLGLTVHRTGRNWEARVDGHAVGPIFRTRQAAMRCFSANGFIATKQET